LLHRRLYFNFESLELLLRFLISEERMAPLKLHPPNCENNDSNPSKIIK